MASTSKCDDKKKECVSPETSLDALIQETAKAFYQRRTSKVILGHRRKEFTPGGAEYLEEEVIGLRQSG